MPELAKPVSPGTTLNEQRNSKSPTIPFVQIKKVFSLAGFSFVVWPVMAPSLTDHKSGLPSQPVRSLPLKIFLNPRSDSAANAAFVWANKAALKASATTILFFMIGVMLSDRWFRRNPPFPHSTFLRQHALAEWQP